MLVKSLIFMTPRLKINPCFERSLLLHDLLAVENEILFLKLAIVFNLNFNYK